MADKVNIMVTAASNTAAWAAVLALRDMDKNFHEQAEAIKERAQAELNALGEHAKERHGTLWNELETALGLDHSKGYSMDSAYLDDHGVAFVVSDGRQRRGDDEEGGISGQIGSLIAQALGGRLVANSGTGGVIEVGPNGLGGD